jgi:hypothetical protein
MLIEIRWWMFSFEMLHFLRLGSSAQRNHQSSINQELILSSMEITDPYQAQPGETLDLAIHSQVFGVSGVDNCPPYSTDDKESNKVKRALKSEFGVTINTGKTQIRSKPYFARYGSDPSTSTEVVAETLPLAICRVALLIAQ